LKPGNFDCFLSLNQKADLQFFHQLLSEANQVMNLTKLYSLSDFLTFHLLDTALILSCLDFKVTTYLDLGSGCGIPGIILHILLSDKNPNLATILCDSRQKRTNYLEETLQKLNLEKKIQVITERAENMAKDKVYYKRFGLITARAFAKPLEALKVIRPFAAPFVYQTSVSLKDDLAYLKALNKSIKKEKHFVLGGKNRFIGLW
jgi:16S rRNA (guanine(527)-N(7))-methyltransferase RsmG